METVRELLEGLQYIRNTLTFWAFLSVIGCVALYIFLRSSKFHGLWSELLGRVLLAEQIFQLAKYFLMGIFSILVLIVVMVGTAPLILKGIEQKSEIADKPVLSKNEDKKTQKAFSDALKVFQEEKDYEQALKLFTDLRPSLNTENSRETVNGLITASYYGSGKHREGLSEICKLYETKPQESIRYRFRIHAHTRRIAINDGFEAAEEVATYFQSSCGRKDFSPVWAGIPLAKMEYLKNGYTVHEESYSLSDEDADYLRKVIKHYPNDAFLDHAHYFLFQFDKVVGTNSILEEVSIVALAHLKSFNPNEHQQYISLLRRYLEKFPTSDRYSDIEYELTSSLLKSGSLSEGLELASQQELGVHQYLSQVSEGFSESVRRIGLLDSLRLAGDYRVSEILSSKWYKRGAWGFLSFHDLRIVLDAFESMGFLHLLKPQFGDLWREYCDMRGIQLIHSSKFRDALDHYRSHESALRASRILVPALLIERISYLEGLIGAAEQDDSQARIEAAIYLRELGAESLALDRFKAMSDDYGNPVEAQKALYLAGAMLRRMGDYGEAHDFFHRLWSSYPHSPLADDALAEVGWYYLIIGGEIEKAHDHFYKVLERYSDWNAADNALNWIAWSNLREGNYSEALAAYLRLSVNFASTRLGERAKETVERLRELVKSARVEKRLSAVRVSGNRISGVDRGVSSVRHGDKITEVNGYSVTDASTLKSALSSVTEDMTKVKIVRGTSEQELTFFFSVEEVTVYEPYLGTDRPH